MSAAIVDAIQNSSFPDSEQILSSDLQKDDIVSLLQELQLTKKELNATVCEISQGQADDVDGWISQAKRVQEDIARCKSDYKYILDEHSRIEALRNERLDARSKVTLLEDEIAFNDTLQKQIQLIASTSTNLNEIDDHINNARLLHAAQSIVPLNTTIENITSQQSRSLLLKSRDELHERLRGQLDASFNNHFRVEKADNIITLSISQNVGEASQNELSLDQLIEALSVTESLADTLKNVEHRIEAKVLPHLHRRSKSYISDTSINGPAITLKLSDSYPEAVATTSTVKSLLAHILDNSPPKIRTTLLQDLSAQIVPLLIVGWLDPAIPLELEQLKASQNLQEKVKEFADWLSQFGIEQSRDLSAWNNQISRIWLAKRKANSLDVVRIALKRATGMTRQVERVEKQTVALDEQGKTSEADDWADNWADDDTDASEVKHSENTEDDASDAWGFDDDDQSSPKRETTSTKAPPEDDEADAWGWGDDEEESKETNKPGSSPTKTKVAVRANGASRPKQSKETEIVLSEKYTVTDVPDLILEGITKDTTDFHALQSSPQTYFKNSTTSPLGMQTLPTLTLAMFRATAPDHYSASLSLSRMNLYNDTLYIMQCLTESAINPSTSLSSDVETLSKFARQTYTSELTTQRTVLHDLLDNAQGFISCTVEPYLSQCESAIASTTDYIRALHSQWSPILSPSHLLQSIGSLLNSVMSKMIKDIEDMEDISEAQSQKLIKFMESVSKLEDLFGTSQSVSTRNAELPSSTIALHVASYLRFQYLQQILEGSLADIKYLWTDAGLGLEFSRDEVMDLIKALFAESSHRRSAIQVIRSGN